MKNYQTLTLKTPVVDSKTMKWSSEIAVSQVEVLAISGTYAMVRKSGCMPFVCSTKELSDIEARKGNV